MYYTDDWKSSGTAIFCPVKQDLYINMSKHDQISATEGGFFTADEQGNISKSVMGRQRLSLCNSMKRRCRSDSQIHT